MTDQAAVLRLLAEEHRAAPEKKPAHAPQRMIAVGSGKGGVGKSNIALNLALEFSWRGRNTCLFDADLGMANASLLAGVVPEHTLWDVLRDGLRFEEIVTRGPMGLGIIAGANGFGDLANMAAEKRARLFRALAAFSSRLDYCVVDAGAGISENVMTFMEKADHCLVVVTPEPTAMADAFGLVKVLSERRCRSRISLVVNRAGTIREARNVAERMIHLSMQFLNQKVDWAGFMLEDSIVQKAVARRSPFSAFQRSSRPARSMARIADCVERGGDLGMPGEDGMAGRLRGWLERLLN